MLGTSPSAGTGRHCLVAGYSSITGWLHDNYSTFHCRVCQTRDRTACAQACDHYLGNLYHFARTAWYVTGAKAWLNGASRLQRMAWPMCYHRLQGHTREGTALQMRRPNRR